jgi:PhnB protein
MQINAYLNYNAQCEAAFKFYERVLGGKIETMMKNEGTPAAAQGGEEWKNQILHASMTIGGNTLMGSDVPPGHYKAPQGFGMSIHIADLAEAQRVFSALGEGGDVKMAMEATFWAKGFGMLVDRFGIPWMVNCA